MPIKISCPGCGKIYTLEDNQIGKSVRCKECEEVFEVKEGGVKAKKTNGANTAQAKDEPATLSDNKPKTRVRPKWHDDDDWPDEDDDTETQDTDSDGEKETKKKPTTRKKRHKKSQPEKKSSLLPVLAVGGLLLLVSLGLTVWFVARKAPQQAAAPVPANENPPVGQPNQNPNPPSENPTPDVPPKTGPRPKAPKGPKRPAPVPQSDVSWKPKPDPLPTPVELPADVQGTIFINSNHLSVRYPSSASAFVCVPQNGPRGELREVWDLRTMKKVGTLDAGGLGGAAALSPDGVYLAGQQQTSGDPVFVWSVADGKPIAKIPVAEPFPRDAAVDFAGPGKLLVGVTSDGEASYHVYDLQTNAEVCRFRADTSTQRARRAISAGGRYLASYRNRKDRILIHDTTTGELVGEATFAVQKSGDILGLAFSPDGNSLAAVQMQGPTSRIIVWDMATGKITGDHKLAKDLMSVAPRGAIYPGPLMEWLPDSSGWFFYGALLVDAKGSALYWTLQIGTKETAQRRMFGLDRVARVRAAMKGKVLRLEKLPADQVATALAEVRANASDDGDRPALTALDWSAAKKLAPVPAPSWQAKIDPRPAAKDKLARTIPLNSKSGDVARVLFSGPEASQVAVLSTPLANELTTKRTIKSDRYDLATGKHLGSNNLFSFEPPKGPLPLPDGDLSPDGSLLMVKGPRGKRLDIWSVADGKHLCAFTPLERGSPNVIQYAAFVDEKRVLTLAGKRLVLWEVPACKAVWYILGVGGAPALSPRHNHVAVCVESAYHLLDVASGTPVGTWNCPGLLGVGSAAFRPDGKQFAAIASTTDKKNVLLRWDATTGALMNNFPTGPWLGEMSWAGENHVMIGPVLFDLTLGWPMANYSVAGTGRHAASSPDGRHWFAAAADSKKSAVLMAQTVPDSTVKDLARGIADKSLQPVLTPGAKLTLQANVAIPGEKDSQRLGEQALTLRLQSQGFQIGAGGPVTLTVQFQGPRPTGETRQYESTDSKQKQVFTVSVEALDGVATLRDAQGVLWEKKKTYTTPDLLGVVFTDNIQSTLTKQLWETATEFVVHFEAPAVVLRGPKGVQALPLPVTLSGDR